MKRKYVTISLRSTDSTNNEAKRRPSDDNLSVITAFEQTAGRGQRGNSWHSTPGLNLTFSILVRWGRDSVPAMPATSQFTVSRIVTVALTDLLSSFGIEARIKWPNDIYVGDRKICGILIEHTVSGPGLSSSVIGIGLNINEKDFPAGIPNPTSVSLETGTQHDTASCLEKFIECFDSSLSHAENAEGQAALEKMYLDRMYRKDTPHQYIDLRPIQPDHQISRCSTTSPLRNTTSSPCSTTSSLCSDTPSAASNHPRQHSCDPSGGRKFTGIIRGVAPNACLLIEDEKGELHRFAFKEIAYII